MPGNLHTWYTVGTGIELLYIYFKFYGTRKNCKKRAHLNTRLVVHIRQTRVKTYGVAIMLTGY